MDGVDVVGGILGTRDGKIENGNRCGGIFDLESCKNSLRFSATRNRLEDHKDMQKC